MKFSIQAFASNKFLSISALVFAAAMLGGCASPPTSEGMTPESIKTTNKHAKSVSVAVSGGSEEGVKISDAAFAQAITTSINNAKTFSSVIQGKGAAYLLTVAISNLDQPVFGFSFTVKLEAGWTLKRADTGAVVWQESINSEHTATPADAFSARTRLKLATEGAGKENISQGLAKISALNL